MYNVSILLFKQIEELEAKYPDLAKLMNVIVWKYHASSFY